VHDAVFYFEAETTLKALVLQVITPAQRADLSC
jgi:hypothetical protein